ncbi:MAG: hypothetical protein CBD88_00425 [Flavobacteriales bacterium TMED228]|mgnify:CR=1 FL=1|jgi:hypothetical protein|nr:MAG: hypothetical protein CBD88_00425 [Flavobacteriales bacterium TMED228]|tara:strand:- start:1093 stop:1323 length:231 start_codon:yes stop_codon:yes gene_type:complete
MKQKELQKEIEKDLDKLGNKYSEMGDEQELFFMAYTSETFLVSMIKNVPASQSLIIFVNILKNILTNLVDTYAIKK